ncbi:MAG: DUF2142 domain-containing protein [Actinomycetota bacterium]|nr:DUF2142 domain-containing protein [Actinomycetota bacterium]
MSRAVRPARAQPPTDAPVEEGRPGRQDRRTGAGEGRQRWSWWTGFAILTLLGGLWSLANPVFSVPDEPAHVVYAAAAVRGELFAPTDGIDTTVTVPATYRNANTAAACFIFYATVPAGCAEPFVAQSGDAQVVTTAGRYPPAYYLYAGSATLLADGATAVYLMRFLTLLACAALLASAFSSARRSRSPWPVTALVLACTPMVLFFMGGVNPQGPELAAGIALWSSALALFSSVRGPDGVAGPVSGRLLARCLITMAVLAVVRPMSIAWLGLIVIVVLVARSTVPTFRAVLRRRATILGGLAIGLLVGASAAWILARDALRQWSRPVDMEASRAALFSVSKLDDEVREMVGIFGWLDTPAPGLVYLVWFGAVGLVVGLAAAVANRRERLALIVIVAVSVMVPVASELSSYGESGFAWQGRYILAFSAGLVVLSGYVLVGRVPAALSVRVCRGLVVAVGAAHVVAFVGNLNRYVHGIGGFWWLDAPGWRPPVPAAVLILSFLAVTAVGVLLLVRDFTRTASPATASELTQPS